jgi:hypothetical protein
MVCAVHESVPGTKRTSRDSLTMSAHRGKADIRRKAATSDFDPKRTLVQLNQSASINCRYLAGIRRVARSAPTMMHRSMECAGWSNMMALFQTRLSLADQGVIPKGSTQR